MISGQRGKNLVLAICSDPSSSCKPASPLPLNRSPTRGGVRLCSLLHPRVREATEKRLCIISLPRTLTFFFPGSANGSPRQLLLREGATIRVAQSGNRGGFLCRVTYVETSSTMLFFLPSCFYFALGCAHCQKDSLFFNFATSFFFLFFFPPFLFFPFDITSQSHAAVTQCHITCLRTMFTLREPHTLLTAA